MVLGAKAITLQSADAQPALKAQAQSARAATAALPAVLLWPAPPASCVGLVRSDQPALLPVAAGNAGLALSAPCVSTPVAKLPHYDRGPGRFTGGQACCRLLGLWAPPTDCCSACMPHHHPPPVALMSLPANHQRLHHQSSCSQQATTTSSAPPPPGCTSGLPSRACAACEHVTWQSST